MIHQIIKDFGGLSQMSRKVNIPLTTIQSWLRAGKIPNWRHDYLEKKAQENGFSIKKYLINEEN